MSEQRIATVAMSVAILMGPILVGLVGCAPRVHVIANPAPDDGGIRYYRPKPYLKVVPAEVQFDRDASKIEPNLVSITLEYLPDFSEEYSIDVRSGLGVADVAITLEDGWNLTEISQDLDSQTDENISAAGEVVKALTGFVPTAAQQGEAAPSFTVPATDVPLGYYESVIGRGPDGRKRLYGFRYVGFLPYQMCPTTMGGSEHYCCGDPSATLYGLTFDSGRMVFRPLVEMQAAEDANTSRPSTDFSATASDARFPLLSRVEPLVLAAGDQQSQAVLAARLEGELLGMLRERFPEVQRVAVQWFTSGNTPRLQADVYVTNDASASRLRQTAVDALASVAQGRFLFDVQIR